MKLLELTGKQADLYGIRSTMVDDECYDWLAARGSWRLKPNKDRNGRVAGFYVRRGKNELLHRVLRPDIVGKVDHHDRNTLNNQRYNLRPATAGQNGMNRRLNRNNTSGLRGVYRSGKKWEVHIGVDNVDRYLGRFFCKLAAAICWDKEALRVYAEFAADALNFPNGPPLCLCDECIAHAQGAAQLELGLAPLELVVAAAQLGMGAAV